MNTKFNVQANFFPGFYESILENSDTSYYGIEEEVNYISESHPGFEVTHDDFVFDYKGYEQEVSECWAENYIDNLDKNIVVSGSYESIVPPRNTGYGPDYRFGTDRMFIDVVLVDDWYDKMVAFINENKDWFCQRIREDWTSRDGFWSYMDNDLQGWLDNLKAEDERYIGSMLGYIMYKQLYCDDIVYELAYPCLENVYAGQYISLNDEKQAEFDEFCKDEAEKRRIKELNDKYQLKIDFGE